MGRTIARWTMMAAGPMAVAACGGAAPDFEAACVAQGDLDTATCACLDDQADRLSPDVQRFVIATIAGDEAAARDLRGDLDRDESLEADRFISTGVQQCLIELPQSPS